MATESVYMSRNGKCVHVHVVPLGLPNAYVMICAVKQLQVGKPSYLAGLG